MTRQSILSAWQSPLRSPHAKRLPHGRLRSNRVIGKVEPINGRLKVEATRCPRHVAPAWANEETPREINP